MLKIKIKFIFLLFKKTCKPPVFMKKALAFYNLGCNDFKVNGEPDMRIKENTILFPERKNWEIEYNFIFNKV